MALRQVSKPVIVGIPYIYTINTFYNGGITFAMSPGAGGGMEMKYRLTRDSEFVAGPLGPVNVYTEDVLLAPVHQMQFISTISDGKVEIIQA